MNKIKRHKMKNIFLNLAIAGLLSLTSAAASQNCFAMKEKENLNSEINESKEEPKLNSEINESKEEPKLSSEINESKEETKLTEQSIKDTLSSFIYKLYDFLKVKLNFKIDSNDVNVNSILEESSVVPSKFATFEKHNNLTDVAKQIFIKLNETPEIMSKQDIKNTLLNFLFEKYEIESPPSASSALYRIIDTILTVNPSVRFNYNKSQLRSLANSVFKHIKNITNIYPPDSTTYTDASFINLIDDSSIKELTEKDIEACIEINDKCIMKFLEYLLKDFSMAGMSQEYLFNYLINNNLNFQPSEQAKNVMCKFFKNLLNKILPSVKFEYNKSQLKNLANSVFKHIKNITNIHPHDSTTYTDASFIDLIDNSSIKKLTKKDIEACIKINNKCIMPSLEYLLIDGFPVEELPQEYLFNDLINHDVFFQPSEQAKNVMCQFFKNLLNEILPSVKQAFTSKKESEKLQYNHTQLDDLTWYVFDHIKNITNIHPFDCTPYTYTSFINLIDNSSIKKLTKEDIYACKEINNKCIMPFLDHYLKYLLKKDFYLKDLSQTNVFNRLINNNLNFQPSEQAKNVMCQFFKNLLNEILPSIKK